MTQPQQRATRIPASAKRSNAPGTTTTEAATTTSRVESPHHTTGGPNNHPRAKRQKMDCPESTATLRSFAKLNPSDATHAKRMASRSKAVQKGKNTIAYEEYVAQVPKHKRRSRSMETPSTPDHTLDVPTKRWQGLVRAWRVALHAYDPPDLATSTPENTVVRTQRTATTTNSLSTQVAETPVRTSLPDLEDTTPISLESASPLPVNSCGNALDFGQSDDDSDDDLL